MTITRKLGRIAAALGLGVSLMVASVVPASAHDLSGCGGDSYIMYSNGSGWWSDYNRTITSGSYTFRVYNHYWTSSPSDYWHYKHDDTNPCW